MDNKQRFAILNEYKNLVKKICPEISEKSGIYSFYRVSEENEKCVYIGKAKNLLERTASHFLGRKSHIDKSLLKHKIYSEDNPYGWKLKVVLECDFCELDKMERMAINSLNQQYFKLYNVESGGTKGKFDINERQQTKLKSYKNGKNLGEIKAKTYVKTMFEKYLDFVIKPPENKVKQRKFEEFKNYLGGKNNGIE